MGVIVLRIAGFYVVILVIVAALIRKLRKRFWFVFGTVMFPLLTAAYLVSNLISFPEINQAHSSNLVRLPSNDLVTLREGSVGAFWPEWIYSFLDINYQGRTLLIPENILESLDLTQEQLKIQGRFSEVVLIGYDGLLSDEEAALYSGLESIAITADDGSEYQLITEFKDPNSPLLLLQYQSRLYFIPQDLLPELEVIQ